MLDKLFQALGYQPIPQEPNELSAKEIADRDELPYIEVLSFELNDNDHNFGAFELDWNDIFVQQLRIAGYQGNTDEDVVENWFSNLCRNIVMETLEQEQADLTGSNEEQYTMRRPTKDGKVEVS